MYSLRPATPADYDFLYRLHCDTIRPYVEATWGWNDEWQEEYFRHKFDPTNWQIIQRPDPAGPARTGSAGLADIGILIVETHETHPAETYIGLIEIAPEHQNQGIGAAIITDLIRQAHAQGRPLTLNVLKANTPARRLYQRLGFTITAEDPVRYKMTNPPVNNEQ
jgi:ribosomal protein S18 acetylase RimI-like enzyme